MGQPFETSRAGRVLIADDDAAIRRLVANVLRRAGFETTEATDGQEAIDRLDGNRFDALVLDVMMPRVDGYGVVNHLMDTQPSMIDKTVIMTAFPQTAMRQRLHDLCCVLAKPFDVRELVSAVELCAAR